MGDAVVLVLDVRNGECVRESVCVRERENARQRENVCPEPARVPRNSKLTMHASPAGRNLPDILPLSRPPVGQSGLQKIETVSYHDAAPPSDEANQA